jgi:hypothetical protein
VRNAALTLAFCCDAESTGKAARGVAEIPRTVPGVRLYVCVQALPLPEKLRAKNHAERITSIQHGTRAAQMHSTLRRLHPSAAFCACSCADRAMIRSLRGRTTRINRIASKIHCGRKSIIRRRAVLWTIFVVLLVLWLLGVVSSYTLGGFIHILLVIALVVLLIQLLSGRRPAL